MIDICLNCKHSDSDRTNDLGEIRCTKFSTFVKPSECCHSHSGVVEKVIGVENKMPIKKAIQIFVNLGNETISDEDKAMAVYLVLNMPTHLSICKEDVINAAKWLFDKAFSFETTTEQTKEQ